MSRDQSLRPRFTGPEPDWEKVDGLLPAIVQDSDTNRVLMLGYMSREALAETLRTSRVTFFSRSRQELWTKGDTSGNRLELLEVRLDCDRDALLVRARPTGPICHRGTADCFDQPDIASREVSAERPTLFLGRLDSIIADRARAGHSGSYTASLLEAGPARVAQKVGEEAVEAALAAVQDDPSSLVDEAADLLYHLLVLLRSRGLSLVDVDDRLAARHRGATAADAVPSDGGR